MLFEWNKDRVVWEEDKPETARYICPHCQGSIDDAQRLAMMDKGKWVDTNPNARELGKLSYHLNSLYSPYISIPEMARKFHDATHSLTVADDLRNFYNSWLALPYEEHCSKVYYADVQSCINGMYHKGIVPDNTRLLVMGVDIGQNVSHWAVSAITYDNKIFVVDWGTMIDFKSDLPDKMGVSRLFDSLKYHNGKGEEVVPDICLVDSGYATEEVYSECMRAQVPGTIMPVKGGTSKAGAWGRSIIRTHPDAPFNLLLFSDFHLKRALYVDLIKQGGLVLPLEADNMIL